MLPKYLALLHCRIYIPPRISRELEAIDHLHQPEAIPPLEVLLSPHQLLRRIFQVCKVM